MSRLTIPSTVTDTPPTSQPSLRAVEKSLGVVPNLFRLVTQSPAALKGYLGLTSRFTGSSLDAAMQERIAVTVAEANGCSYCLSAHTYLGRNVAKLDDAEITANRNGASNDPKADAALRFTAAIVHTRGHVSDEALAAVNEVAQTPIDFPVATSRRIAA